MSKTYVFHGSIVFIAFLLICSFAGNVHGACYCSGNTGYWCTGPGFTNCLPNAACNWACSSWSDVGHTINQQFINNNFNTWQQTGEGKPGYPPGHDQFYDVGPLGDRENQAINDYFDQLISAQNDKSTAIQLKLQEMVAKGLWDEKNIEEFLALLPLKGEDDLYVMRHIFNEVRDAAMEVLLEQGYSRSDAELTANENAAAYCITVCVIDDEDDSAKLGKSYSPPENSVPLNKSILCPFASLSSKYISIPLVIR